MIIIQLGAVSILLALGHAHWAVLVGATIDGGFSIVACLGFSGIFWDYPSEIRGALPAAERHRALRVGGRSLELTRGSSDAIAC